jgi:hypothetical protein
MPPKCVSLERAGDINIRTYAFRARTAESNSPEFVLELIAESLHRVYKDVLPGSQGLAERLQGVVGVAVGGSVYARDVLIRTQLKKQDGNPRPT